jgi:hypothetical protein
MAATILVDDDELVKKAKLLATRDDRGLLVHALLEFEGSGTTPFGWLSFPPPQSQIEDLRKAIWYAEPCIKLEIARIDTRAQGTRSSPEQK